MKKNQVTEVAEEKFSLTYFTLDKYMLTLIAIVRLCHLYPRTEEPCKVAKGKQLLTLNTEIC